MEKEALRESKELIRAILELKSEAAQDMSLIFAMGVETGQKLAEAAAKKEDEGERDA